MIKLKNCSICGRIRYNKNIQDYALWRTDIIINDAEFGLIKDKRITICPQCREIKLNKLYNDYFFK